MRRGWWVLAALIPCGAAAQAPVTEWWPELDVYYRPAEHQRTFLELASQTETEGTKHQATAGLYQDYLWLPRAFIRGGYRFTFSTRDASYRESRLVGEATVTAYSTNTVRLINRLRGELRWVNSEYSWRLRDRLHLQHLSQKTYGPRWAPYVTFEPYYDSRYNTIARLAGRVGTELQVVRHVAMDVYVARQENSRGQPGAVNALGLTVKLTY